MLTDSKLEALIECGRGQPWNGYELLQMEKSREASTRSEVSKALTAISR